MNPKEMQDRLLVALYQSIGQNFRGTTTGEEAKQRTGFSEPELQQAAGILHTRGYLSDECPMGSLRLSHSGQHAAELVAPHISLSPVPPPTPSVVHNVVNISHSPGASVMNASPGATQKYGVDATAIAALINAIEQRLPAARLAPSVAQDVAADIAAVRASIAGASPRPSILKAGLESLKSGLQGVASNALAEYVPQLTAAISSIL